MITVKVKMFASFRDLLPDQRLGESSMIELPDSAMVIDLVRRLNLPQARLIFVNGIARACEEYLLSDGDEIGVFPLLGGG